MPRARQTNLTDVAKAAGVNTSTASRILNDAPNFKVTPEVRAAVHAAASRLGYRPSPLGRALRAKRTGMIAILGLWPNFFERPQHSSQVVQAASKVLYEAGYDVLAAMPRPWAERFHLGSLLVDGALALIPGAADSLAELDASGIPYVSIDGPAGPGGDSWWLDDRDASQQLMAHLLALGHRRLAWWSGINFSHHSLSERRESFCIALQRAGLVEATPQTKDPNEFLRSCRAEGITAVVVYGGEWAMHLRASAVAMGLRIPEDLSMATFNDEPDVAAVGLTTIAWPAAKLGTGVAHALVARLNGTRANTPAPVLRGELKIRSSTQAPPSIIS